MTEFQQILLRALSSKLGDRGALAAALNVTRSRVNGALGGSYKMSVAACLRLSVVTGDDPLHVLRAAERDDEARLIADIFGTPGRDRLTTSQKDLLADVMALSAEDRLHVRAIIRRLADAARRDSRDGTAAEALARRGPQDVKPDVPQGPSRRGRRR